MHLSTQKIEEQSDAVIAVQPLEYAKALSERPGDQPNTISGAHRLNKDNRTILSARGT